MEAAGSGDLHSVPRVELRQAHPVHLTVAAVLIQIGNGAAILSGGDSWVGSLGLRA
ncbi:MAG: hypothetical protein ACYCZN_08585 [Candidatus Dormibacteria bacterium]